MACEIFDFHNGLKSSSIVHKELGAEWKVFLRPRSAKVCSAVIKKQGDER